MTEINSIANRIMHIVRAIRLDINTGGSSEDLILRRVDGIEKLATELMAAPSRNEILEEAVRICETYYDTTPEDDACARDLAIDIRALKR